MLSVTRKLQSDEVRLRFDAQRLDFQDTTRLPEPDRLVGQRLAVDAIDFAFGVDSGDFHLFAAGPSGTGRTTIVKAMATQAARRRPVPPDLCCVYNFNEPEHPHIIRLPAGSGRVFAAELTRFADIAHKSIPAELSSREFRNRQQSIIETHIDAKREHFEKLEAAAKAVDIHVEISGTNVALLPLTDENQPMTEEQYAALEDAEQKAIEERERGLRDDILAYLEAEQGIQDEMEQAIDTLERQSVTKVLEPRLNQIRETLRFPDVHGWLDELLEDVLETLDTFLPEEDAAPEGLALALRGSKSPEERYDVNVIVDNSDLDGAPVILELNPTYATLVGKVERRISFGAMDTNHTLVRAGALHRANGGILILDAAQLVSHPHSYPALKRALREGALTIQDPEDPSGVSTVSLRPEPVPIKVQIVLIGSLDDYIVLRQLDPEFSKLVKVRADFEDSADLEDDIANGIARFVGSVCRERNLLHFTADGVAALIERGARVAGRKDEVSLRLDAMRSTIVEADYWARKQDATLVDRTHVETTNEKLRERSGLFLRRTLKEFRRKNLLISVAGKRIGQVNGLAVLGVGDILFGMPSRITCKTFMGDLGLVNVERESELSGQIHSKAVLILNGYLGWKYAQNQALTLSASLTFEQNYSFIEGDSASIAELAALLSSLSKLPVRQDLAVTGSMNQHGEVQPIGGVNEKVEGFFRVCALDGLTGAQGVVIPAQNAADLNLAKDVADAIADGRFHVWAVHTVDEALGLLLDTEAGEWNDAERTFLPVDGIHALARARLAEMADAANGSASE